MIQLLLVLDGFESNMGTNEHHLIILYFKQKDITAYFCQVLQNFCSKQNLTNLEAENKAAAFQLNPYHKFKISNNRLFCAFNFGLAYFYCTMRNQKY